MQLRSLGYRSDLIFIRFDGQVTDRGSYLVVRSPSNPNYYWGNMLIFDRPPGEGDWQRWPELFAGEIGRPPGVKHQTFGWDSTEGEIGRAEEFVGRGYRLIQMDVLATSEVRPPRHLNEGVQVRPLRSDDDWQAALDNQLRNRDDNHEESSYREFRRRQNLRYRTMQDAGLGYWYGAFLEGQLVADLGLYVLDGLARFQNVVTDADHRRRGVAGTMVYRASLEAVEKLGAEQLVIIADRGSDAGRLYRSLGYELAERQAGLEWWQGMPPASLDQ